MDVEQPIASSSSKPIGSADIITNMAPRPLAQSKGGRSAGKAHKSDKVALRRNYISPAVKTPFQKRMEKQKVVDATKGVEREMKDEQAAERER
jgi:rRNA-processing protein CGR1